MTGPVNPDTFQYDGSTQFAEDNSPIPAGTLARYEYGLSQVAGGPYGKILTDSDFTPTPLGKQTYDLDITGLAFGQWYAVARAVSKDGPVSPWSNEIAFVVQAKTPKPPANFSAA